MIAKTYMYYYIGIKLNNICHVPRTKVQNFGEILPKFHENFGGSWKNSEISYIKLIYVLYNNNISFRFNFF